MHMTLQSLSHSSNGSLQASYILLGSREKSREKRCESSLSLLCRLLARCLAASFVCKQAIQTRSHKGGSGRLREWSQGEFRLYKNILSLTCKYPGLIALQELYGLVRQTSKDEQIASANELAESVCQGVIEIVISGHYARLRKGYGSNNGRI